MERTLAGSLWKIFLTCREAYFSMAPMFKPFSYKKESLPIFLFYSMTWQWWSQSLRSHLSSQQQMDILEDWATWNHHALQTALSLVSWFTCWEVTLRVNLISINIRHLMIVLWVPSDHNLIWNLILEENIFRLTQKKWCYGSVLILHSSLILTCRKKRNRSNSIFLP